MGSEITVVEMLPRIAGNTEAEIASLLQKNYEKAGVKFRLGCKVTAVGPDSVTFEENGQTQSVPADKVLVSIGRRPVTKGFGLETLNPVMDRAAIKADEFGRTSVPGLFAAGDVNGVSMRAHTAYRESEVVINNLTGKKDRMRYNAIPAVIYTNPEVASVGETLESAQQKGMKVRGTTISMLFSGRYVAENEGGNGICKIVVEEGTDRLVGVHLLGNYASEIIYGAALMIARELRVADIKELVFPHPTVSEIIREALFAL